MIIRRSRQSSSVSRKGPSLVLRAQVETLSADGRTLSPHIAGPEGSMFRLPKVGSIPRGYFSDFISESTRSLDELEPRPLHDTARSCLVRPQIMSGDFRQQDSPPFQPPAAADRRLEPTGWVRRAEHLLRSTGLLPVSAVVLVRWKRALLVGVRRGLLRTWQAVDGCPAKRNLSRTPPSLHTFQKPVQAAVRSKLHESQPGSQTQSFYFVIAVGFHGLLMWFDFSVEIEPLICEVGIQMTGESRKSNYLRLERPNWRDFGSKSSGIASVLLLALLLLPGYFI